MTYYPHYAYPRHLPLCIPALHADMGCSLGGTITLGLPCLPWLPPPYPILLTAPPYCQHTPMPYLGAAASATLCWEIGLYTDRTIQAIPCKLGVGLPNFPFPHPQFQFHPTAGIREHACYCLHYRQILLPYPHPTLNIVYMYMPLLGVGTNLFYACFSLPFPSLIYFPTLPYIPVSMYYYVEIGLGSGSGLPVPYHYFSLPPPADGTDILPHPATRGTLACHMHAQIGVPFSWN